MRRIAALAFPVVLSSIVTATADDGFTAADVLAWERKNQDAYFETSISMAAVIASRNKSETAACIDQWYFASKAATDTQNDEIRIVMRQYAGNHPGIVIAAVIERACGSLSFSE
ncbi:MAG: hypothetical protein AAF292_17815 [Pseudomonadota bacterium]